MNARLAPHWCSAAGPQILWCPASLMDEQLGLNCVSRAQAPALLSQGIGHYPQGLVQGACYYSCPGPALWLVEGLSLVCRLPPAASGQTVSCHSFLKPMPRAAFLSDLRSPTPCCWEPRMLWETGQ